MTTTEDRIRAEVYARQYAVDVTDDWYTPSGKRRSQPVYHTTVRNEYLAKERVLRAPDRESLLDKVSDQLQRWNEEEIRRRLSVAHTAVRESGRARCEQLDREARAAIASLREILTARYGDNLGPNWQEALDFRAFPPPVLPETPPERPVFKWPAVPVPRPFQSWFFISQWNAWASEGTVSQIRSEPSEARLRRWRDDYDIWQAQSEAAQRAYDLARADFERTRDEHNARVLAFQERFESGDSAAICEYLNAVFDRSVYPDCFPIQHSTSFDAQSGTAVVDLRLPAQDDVPDIVEYRYVARSGEAKPVRLKKAAADDLYDSAIKQTVLRTLYEVFQSVNTSHVQAAVANGWVTYVDRATGQDVTSCIISVSADRHAFESLDLARVDPAACVKSLRGLVAGPLSNVAPVQPLMHLDREDRRFVEGREVLADLNTQTNLAEISWEEFEQLVRELFALLFAGDGTEVRVTQASRDQGVDAIAFDPDPIRGGKFVIQAKRYTNVVPVSAVRDLYGTMISEGAVKGILVTTSHYGRDSHEFAKGKPLTLLDGPNLVHLLNQHGHAVRIDIKAARAKRSG